MIDWERRIVLGALNCSTQNLRSFIVIVSDDVREDELITVNPYLWCNVSQL